LWEEINNPVKAGIMHFVIEPVLVLPDEVKEEVIKFVEQERPRIAEKLYQEHEDAVKRAFEAVEQTVETPATSYIKYEDFEKIDLRVATILEAEAVPKADKLVKLKVDAGDPEPRTIVAGIRLHYAPETLVGTQITIIANLEPRKLRGIESQGMLLAAGDDIGLSLIRPDKSVKPGSKAK
jgi:methionyl-tRNA synthetase